MKKTGFDVENKAHLIFNANELRFHSDLGIVRVIGEKMESFGVDMRVDR